MTTRRGRVSGTVLAVAASGLVLAAQGQAPSTVFRGNADVVTIDVLVRAGDTPIGGLDPKDFALTDNGVSQQVEAVELDSGAVDITIVIDTTNDVADYLKGVLNQARRIAAMARPIDRVRVMRIGTYVTDLVPLRPAAGFPAIPDLAPAGIPSAHDALAFALLRQVDPTRRHLVIALTNGIDAISALDADAVRSIAQRSNATLHIAQVDIAVDPDGLSPLLISGRERLDLYRARAGTSGRARTDPWRPFDDEQFDVLEAAAHATGGAVKLPGIFVDRTASAVFENAFAEFRRRYLLRYTPTGVRREGWHDVRVTLPKHPSYSIQARHGYGIDAPGPTPAPVSAAAPAGRTADTSKPNIASIAEAYGRADYAGARSILARAARPDELIRAFAQGGNPWPANPRREAAFVVELAEAGLQSHSRDAKDSAARLLFTYRKLVRDPIEPDGFERYWLWTALALLEGANINDIGQTMADDALRRFPDEARFVLAKAVFADLRYASMMPGGRPDSADAIKYVQDVGALYDAAITRPAVSPEATIRKAWLLIRGDRHIEALALLDGTADTIEPADIAYLRQLFRARALEALNRLDDAAAAYERALARAPGAQSARIGLMNVRLRTGNRRDAEALAERVQSDDQAPVDPWWFYWLGDDRLLPEMLQRMRDQTK